ncbi:uncharacterized protein [Ptychodera flava]|uniref:uncharacterized protein n=1 Tax=Ptychodera flava TaxID=63121 RepID=UPI00396A4745
MPGMLFPEKENSYDGSTTRENEAEIWRLKDELLTSRVNIPPEDEESSPPRPGILKKHIAERFQMLEVMPGSRVFIYEQQMNDARNKLKESGTKAALFLLQCFYKTKDLVGKK